MSSWLRTSKQWLWPLWPQHQREWYRSHTCTTLLHLQSRDNDNTWIQTSTVMHYSSSTDHHLLDTWRLWTSSKKSLKVCLGLFLCPGTHFTGFLAVPCTLSAQSLSQLFLFPCHVFTQATQRPSHWPPAQFQPGPAHLAPILSCYSSPIWCSFSSKALLTAK